MSVCVRERARKRKRECVCERERARESERESVCERKRKRERSIDGDKRDITWLD